MRPGWADIKLCKYRMSVFLYQFHTLPLYSQSSPKGKIKPRKKYENIMSYYNLSMQIICEWYQRRKKRPEKGLWVVMSW